MGTDRYIDLQGLDNKILNASANEFQDTWAVFCNCGLGAGDFYNPYYKGTRGNWRVKKSYAYLTDRNQTTPKTVLRKDGTYTSFSPFWQAPGTADLWTVNNTDLISIG